MNIANNNIKLIENYPSGDWKSQLADSSHSLESLLKKLGLKPEQLPSVWDARQNDKHIQDFPIKATEHFISNIAFGDPKDPLLLQVLPQQQENIRHLGYTADPLQESTFNPIPGVVHKYKHRLLLTITPACAIHCRYCFRKEFDYQSNTGGKQHLQQAFQYIEQHPEITEVILSGGDPLATNDKLLLHVIEQLNAITQVKTLRIHSRIPIVLPQRITARFLNVLTKWKGKLVIVVHCNHPNELDPLTVSQLKKLSDSCDALLNQAVLLKGINDDVEVLENLCRKVFDAKVMPYYLFLLDKVSGTAHFDIPESEAVRILSNLSAILPGYLMPKLTREIPEKHSKTLISF